MTLMQTLSSCAGVLRCRNTRNSDAAPADHGDCPKARTRKEIFTDGAAGGRCARINISAACTRAAEASCRGRSLPLSTRCRLPLRRVVSESTALPHPARELADRRRMQAGRAASSPGRASSGGCGRVALTAGEVCRAAGCPTGKGILCDESQTFPLQVNGTEKSPGVSTPGQQVTEAREL